MISIFSYLVKARKGADPSPAVEGTTIEQGGKLRERLEVAFDESDEECITPIVFSSPEGNQHNDARTELITAAKSPSEDAGRRLAERLQSVTTARSGMGLLFVMVGCLGDKHKIVVSRYPAEAGILADSSSDGLQVEFVDKVFMKSSFSYKAAVYTHRSLDNGFWKGRVVDKQINSRLDQVASYWIKDFLLSEFEMTPRAGSKMLASALRKAVDSADSIEVKQELVSVATLVQQKDGKAVSVANLVNSYDISEKARSALLRAVRPERSVNQTFTFSSEEFAVHNPFQSIELDNGAYLTGPMDKFARIFTQEAMDQRRAYRFTTTGTIIDQKLRSQP